MIHNRNNITIRTCVYSFVVYYCLVHVALGGVAVLVGTALKVKLAWYKVQKTPKKKIRKNCDHSKSADVSVQEVR